MTLETPIRRLLKRPERSFFLFGPRGTGKSTWLQQVLPEAFRLDLLDASLYLELSRDPHRLEALVGNQPSHTWVILANKRDVPYQSLAKVFLARQIFLERESLSPSSRKRKTKAASRSK
jgi:hypothetical protein